MRNIMILFSLCVNFRWVDAVLSVVLPGVFISTVIAELALTGCIAKKKKGALVH